MTRPANMSPRHNPHHPWFFSIFYTANGQIFVPEGQEFPAKRDVLRYPPRQRPAPNTTISNRPKSASPIRAAVKRLKYPLHILIARAWRRTKQDDAARCRQAPAKGKFPEVLVKRDEHAILRDSPGQNELVA